MGVLDTLQRRAHARGEKEGLERGRVAGKEEGKAEGKAEAKAETLLRLMSLRFGKQPAAIRKRVLAADDKSLDRWIDRLLEAPDAEALLDG